MDVELLQSTHESVIGGALNYRELTKKLGNSQRIRTTWSALRRK